MGGHLSCISCKNEKENNSENKPKKKKEAQNQPSSSSSSSSHATALNAKYCPVTSGWELYQILQSRNGVVQKDEEKLSDVEKVAQAIVEINVYLASQVIYPAIQRYLQELQLNEVDGKKEEIDRKISS